MYVPGTLLEPAQARPMLTGHVGASRTSQVLEFHGMLDRLNGYMEAERIPAEMRQRLREFLHNSKHLRANQKKQKLLTTLSDALQAEYAGATHSKWLS